MEPMAPKPNPELDEKIALPLDPEEALRALLAVDPEDEPGQGDDQAQED